MTEGEIATFKCDKKSRANGEAYSHEPWRDAYYQL